MTVSFPQYGENQFAPAVPPANPVQGILLAPIGELKKQEINRLSYTAFFEAVPEEALEALFLEIPKEYS